MTEHFPVERHKIKYRERFVAPGDDVAFYDDLTILYNSEYNYEVIPFNNLPQNRFVNAIIRMVILLVVGFVVNTYIFSAISFMVNSAIGILYLVGLYSGGKLFSKKEKMGGKMEEKEIKKPTTEDLLGDKKIDEKTKEKTKENEKENEAKEQIEHQIFDAMLTKFFTSMEEGQENYEELLTNLDDKKDIKFMKKVDVIHKEYGGKNFTTLPFSEAVSETINRRLKRFRNQRKVKHPRTAHKAHRDTVLLPMKQRRVIG